jgi:hypothetical protein
MSNVERCSNCNAVVAGFAREHAEAIRILGRTRVDFQQVLAQRAKSFCATLFDQLIGVAYPSSESGILTSLTQGK